MSDMREKLIDEAIAHFDYGVIHDIFSEPVTTYAKLAGAALEYIRHVTDTDFGKWIPVSERLPENLVDVLVWYEYFAYGERNRMVKAYGIGCYLTGCGVWSGDPGHGSKVKVTHWMPIPEAPKGE